MTSRPLISRVIPTSLPRPAVCAGVGNQKVDAQRLGPLDLAPEGHAGLRQDVTARLGGQVNEVRVVRDGLGKAAFADDPLERLRQFWGDGGRTPLSRRSRKDLDGMAADLDAVRDGIVMPARRGHVCAEEGLEEGRDGGVEGFAEEWRVCCCHRGFCLEAGTSDESIRLCCRLISSTKLIASRIGQLRKRTS